MTEFDAVLDMSVERVYRAYYLKQVKECNDLAVQVEELRKMKEAEAAR